MGNKTRVHKFYHADDMGGSVNYEILRVFVDRDSNLKLGHRLTVPAAEVESCQLVPLPGRAGKFFIAITIRSPKLNAGEPTTIHLIHRNFWNVSSTKKMQAFVDELAPIIKDNTFESKPEFLTPQTAPPDGTFSVWYSFNFSLLIAFYHRTWLAYDTRLATLLKTYLLMLIVGPLNFVGILLFILPTENWKMSRNIETVGRSRKLRVMIYALSLLLPYGFWTVMITRMLFEP